MPGFEEWHHKLLNNRMGTINLYITSFLVEKEVITSRDFSGRRHYPQGITQDKRIETKESDKEGKF